MDVGAQAATLPEDWAQRPEDEAAATQPGHILELERRQNQACDRQARNAAVGDLSAPSPNPELEAVYCGEAGAPASGLYWPSGLRMNFTTSLTGAEGKACLARASWKVAAACRSPSLADCKSRW